MSVCILSFLFFLNSVCKKGKYKYKYGNLLKKSVKYVVDFGVKMVFEYFDAIKR